jgi:hypothetical protein
MTTQNPGNPPRLTSTFVATTAIACFAYFVLALLLLHVLRPDRAPGTRHHFYQRLRSRPVRLGHDDSVARRERWLPDAAAWTDSQRPPFGCRSARHAPDGNPFARPADYCDLSTEQEGGTHRPRVKSTTLLSL